MERGGTAAPYLRVLGQSLGSDTLEGAEPNEARLSAERLLAKLENRFQAADQRHGPPDPETVSLRQQILADAERALVRTIADPAAALPPPDVTALEALVRTSGRPALTLSRGSYDPADPEIDDYWHERLFRAGPIIETVVASVGRIELGGLNAGTGFVIAPGVIATNRHVLEGIATLDPASQSWVLAENVEINFDGQSGSASRSAFPVTAAVFAGPAPIGEVVKPGQLDLALLSVESRDSLPPPLPLAADSALAQGHCDLAVIGYPAQPASLPRRGNGRIDPEILVALQRIFRAEWDVKRLSLGRVDRRLGEVAQDATPPWCFGHDATTLGGNSGSVVAVLDYFEDDRPRVIGLHLGGQWLLQNFAHALAAIPALRDGMRTPAIAKVEWI